MSAPADERLELRPDCGACVGLCCVALPFERSADFALDKPAGMPCANLSGRDRCTIHAGLCDAGFAGCTAFDCLGAGQQVTQVTFGGASWRDSPATAAAMFAAFETMRAVHELRWYLAEARSRTVDAALADGIDDLATRVPLLREASARARGQRRSADLAQCDLAGQDLRRHDLRDADLRGALLIGADLRGQDLTRTDLLGADLRGTDLRGADLHDALFPSPTTGGRGSRGRGHAHTGGHRATRALARNCPLTSWPYCAAMTPAAESR